MSNRFSFTIHATDGRARVGTIAMQRGEIRTPAFMPVGTAATIEELVAARSLRYRVFLSGRALDAPELDYFDLSLTGL